jgi:hypothetical protein
LNPTTSRFFPQHAFSSFLVKPIAQYPSNRAHQPTDHTSRNLPKHTVSFNGTSFCCLVN